MQPAMQFSHGGNTYRISFKHEHFQDNSDKLSGGAGFPVGHNWRSLPVRGRTTCSIRVWKDGTDPKGAAVIGKGVTECSLSDNYNKETGRQNALRRAISDAWPIPSRLWETIA